MSELLPVVLIEGDGIGPEICGAVKKVFEAAQVPIRWVPARAGLGCIQDHGNGCPEETIEAIRTHGVALKGPTTTPIAGGHKSVNVTIRKALDLYANVRPSRSLPGIETRFSGVKILLVRENIEDTYGGIEHMQSKDVAQCLRLITRRGSQKIARFAFELARQQSRQRVTCIHKANIMKMTDGLFLEVFRETAAQFPELEAADMLVDNCCMQLVSRPQQFDVLVLPNLFGDIVSDLCAGIVGGLGVAPGANIGDRCAVFEAVHGSAPDIAGLGKANPTAILLSSILMLRHLGLPTDADRIEYSLRTTLESGIRTGDLGGKASTIEFADAICRSVEATRKEGAEWGRETPTSSRFVIPDFPRPVPAERALDGFDVFIEHDGLPAIPAELGPFKLQLISNRGTKVYPGPTPDIHMTDIHRCRYVPAREGAVVSDAEITAALAQLDSKFTWVHVEKLLRIDGKQAYSKAQGQ